MEAIRCFIAVDVADEVREALTREHRLLSRQAKGYRWVDPVNYHLTIKFLGNVSADKLLDIGNAVRRSAAGMTPFTVRLHGFDAFPYRSNPRVVWVGVKEGIEELRRLWRGVDHELVALGFPPDQRAYTPHLTIGRAKSGRGSDDLMPLFRRLEGRDWGGYTVDSVSVMKSELKRKGPVYSVVERVDFE